MCHIKWANGCGESFEDRRRMLRSEMGNNRFHFWLFGGEQSGFLQGNFTLEKESTAAAAK